jgi:hypothetical protein
MVFPMLRFVIKLPTKLPSPGKFNPTVQQKTTLRLMIILLLFKNFSNINEVLVCVHGNIRNNTDLFHKYHIFVTYFFYLFS